MVLYSNDYMMKRLFLSLFWCAVSWIQVSAQQKFVDKLVKPVNGQGTVRVIQDAEITRMVNAEGQRRNLLLRLQIPDVHPSR